MTNTVEKTLQDIEAGFQENAWSYSVDTDGVIHSTFDTDCGPIDILIRIEDGEPEYCNSTSTQFVARMPFHSPLSRIPELASLLACVNGHLRRASFAIDPLDGCVHFFREHIAIGGHIEAHILTTLITDYLTVMGEWIKPAIMVSHFNYLGVDAALETMSLLNEEFRRDAGFNIDGPENDDETPSKDFDLVDEEE